MIAASVTMPFHRLPSRRFSLSVCWLSSKLASDPLAAQFRSGDSKQYIAGDGTVTEIAAENRGAPVSFTGTTDAGQTVSSSQYLGQVLVLNFWYAGCAPCRAEAPALETLNTKYTGNGASFLGFSRGTALGRRRLERQQRLLSSSVFFVRERKRGWRRESTRSSGQRDLNPG